MLRPFDRGFKAPRSYIVNEVWFTSLASFESSSYGSKVFGTVQSTLKNNFILKVALVADHPGSLL